MIHRSTTRTVTPLLALLALVAMTTGCATPSAVRTEDDLSRNVGNKVTLDGRYEVGRSGETLDAGAFTVELDRSGGVTPPVGAPIRATGVVARGAMSLGVFIDEFSLRSMRAQKDVESRNVPASGYVLRKASVEIVEGGPSDAKEKR